MSEIKEGMVRQSLGDWAREEGAFAVALGLKRDKLAALRKEHLEEGEHWGRLGRKGGGGGGRITYKVGGEVKMRGLVALLIGVPESEMEVDEEVGREEPEDMEVVKVYPVNRRLVECLREGGEKVRVNVGSNENFMSGMVLKARPPWGDGRRGWVIVGARPRWRGKW